MSKYALTVSSDELHLILNGLEQIRNKITLSVKELQDLGVVYQGNSLMEKLVQINRLEKGIGEILQTEYMIKSHIAQR